MSCIYRANKIDCSQGNKAGVCEKCGWHPVVEAERKKMDLALRKGYIGCYGEIKDRRHKYRGIVLGKEKG